MTTTRVTVKGLPNEPVNATEVDALLRPILDLLGLARKDVATLTVSAGAIRAKVAVRNDQGRRLPRSWAHVEVAIEDDYEEGDPR